VASAFVSGCQANYLLQQGIQYIRLLQGQEPLRDLEASEKLSPEAREKLRWVQPTLDFCRKRLGLDPGKSYQAYLDTKGGPISYVVTAAHPLALLPYLWCFPLVGAVPYKGYFDEEDAQKEAKRLRKEGFEALVTPVGAFSTLGWFNDPFLSTMLDGSVADLADFLIHETTHRTLYFPGRSSFNESLATHMAREGVIVFFSSHPELRKKLPEYLARKDASRERELFFLRLRNDLDALYRSTLPDETKKARKLEIFGTASSAYQRLLPGPLRAPLPASNALVLSVARYHEFEPLLARLQAALGGKPSDLMAYLKKLPASENPVPIIEEALSARGP
jgi:predicted aminopeptidase